MLDHRLQLDSIDAYYDAIGSQPLTIFQGSYRAPKELRAYPNGDEVPPNDYNGKPLPVRKPPIVARPDKPVYTFQDDVPPQRYTDDGYGALGLGQSQSYGVEQALGLQLTDKSTRGVYESKPIVKTGSVFDRLLSYAKDSAPPVNASVLNNPALENFETIKFGNPLEANFADSTAQASGQDDAGFLSGAGTVADIVGAAADPSGVTGSILPHPSSYLNSDVLKQSGVFIVGAIILAIGIFALTR